ncbi:anti-sigma-I factor RsgI family protein [Paenibacillus pasadenensis]|uniref:anti-sigma-I factor RsgI family protein n=1 Tax=Paenibacillus pasadenensis TaxID=217090 RepID=UPI0004116C6F|nr:anti-sigma factor domain-containing protein [Paenibacillus pasadenensis]
MNGIVLEVKKGSVIVLTPDGSFRKIRSRGGEAVGQEVELPPAVRAVRPRWMLPAAAGALALLLAIPVLYAGRAAAHPVVAYISLDINPSFEVGVDADLMVRQLRAVNADAVPLVQELDYSGQPASLVMEELAERLAESDYLKQETAKVLLAGVRLKGNGEELTELGAQARHALESAAEQAGEDGLQVTELRSTPQVLLEAEELGLSVGQMTVYLLAMEKGYDVSLDRLRTQPLPATAVWQGGLDALVPDSAELDEEKLDRLLEAEKSARAKASAVQPASPAAERAATPSPPARPAAEKPPAAASAPARTATPPAERQREPEGRPSAHPPHGPSRHPASAQPSGNVKAAESRERDQREFRRGLEQWKREAEQARRTLERKQREAERRLEQARDSRAKEAAAKAAEIRSEAEQRIREAADRWKREQEKAKSSAEAKRKKAEAQRREQRDGRDGHSDR